LDKAITGVFGLNDGGASPNLAELSPPTIFKLAAAVADAIGVVLPIRSFGTVLVSALAKSGFGRK